LSWTINIAHLKIKKPGSSARLPDFKRNMLREIRGKYASRKIWRNKLREILKDICLAKYLEK
jgi:hypothetical protein